MPAHEGRSIDPDSPRDPAPDARTRNRPAFGRERGGVATFSPLYLQIKALITDGLQAGEWKPGEAIPSEVELARATA